MEVYDYSFLPTIILKIFYYILIKVSIIPKKSPCWKQFLYVDSKRILSGISSEMRGWYGYNPLL